jgi:hypothetical protein
MRKDMNSISKVAAIIVLCLLSNAFLFAQDDKPGSEVPPGLMSMLIVSDPKSPINITGPFRVLGYSYGGLELGYTLQNSSNADIESCDIEESDWFGANGYEKSFDVKKDQRFSPGMARYSFPDDALDGLIPFDHNKGLQSHVTSPRNKIWIVMVVKVKLTDGTVYDATKKFEQLEKFLSEMDRTSMISAPRLKERETELREYISKLMTQEK